LNGWVLPALEFRSTRRRMGGMSFKDRVTVASEKADFIADRIAAGVAAPEAEVRRLAATLRQIAAELGPGHKRPGERFPRGVVDATHDSAMGKEPSV
jgi:hypothetical protein